MINSDSGSHTGLVDSGYLLLYNYNSTKNLTPGETAAFHYGIGSPVTNRGYNSSFIICINNLGGTIYGGFCNLNIEMFTKNSIFYNNTASQGIIQFWIYKHSMENCNFLKNFGRNDYTHNSGCILTYYNCKFDIFNGTGTLINHIITSNFITIYLYQNPFCSYENLRSYNFPSKFLILNFFRMNCNFFL